MSKRAKPYPLGKTILVGLALAATFLLLSLFFQYKQARNSQVRLTGEVVAVADGVMIRSAKGKDTILTFASDAKLRGVNSISAIAEGQHVMVRGEFTDSGRFEVEGLRVVRSSDKK